MTLDALFAMFPYLTVMVKNAHEHLNAHRVFGSGHSFHHAITVANYALQIAPDEDCAKYAAIAGLCHNAGKVLARKNGEPHRVMSARSIQDYIYRWLVEFKGRRREYIIADVVAHEEPNNDNDRDTLIVLKDAVRLARMDAFCLVRAGQFHPDIPIVHSDDLNGPSNDLLNPRSIVDDCLHALQCFGVDGPRSIRVRKAREIGWPLAERLRDWRQEVLDGPVFHFMMDKKLLP